MLKNIRFQDKKVIGEIVSIDKTAESLFVNYNDEKGNIKVV